MTTRSLAAEKYGQLLETIRRPGGYSKLSMPQKKLLYSFLLASVVPADLAVKPEEIATLRLQLRNYLQVNSEMSELAVAMASLPSHDGEKTDALSAAMGELLGIEDRKAIVRRLWELALSDHELHSAEERLIFRISDKAGVPRKQVAEELARVSAQVK